MNKVESALSRTTDTKALVIGIETLPRVADMFKELFPGRRALVVADANTWRAAGSDVHRILAQAGIAQDEPHVFTDPKLYAEWTFVEQLDGVLSRTDAIPVAVGSGVINDLTKLCSHHNGRRYMVVGTAASMDGYTAYGASITKDGNKQTFDCPAPLGMVLDPTIAAAAPAKMSASGYADLIAKIPAGADWMLADAVGSELLDEFAFSVVQDGLKDALCDPAGVRAGNVAKVEQLAEGLLLSGFASRTPVQPPVGHGTPQIQRRIRLARFQGRHRHAGFDGFYRDAARYAGRDARHRKMRRRMEIVGGDRKGYLPDFRQRS